MKPTHSPAQFSLFDATVPLRSESVQEFLPSTAQELVEVIGINATIDLVKTFPGDDLKIPEVVNGTSRMWEILVETVGAEAAAKLVHRYGGTAIYVPVCQRALLVVRNRTIIERFDKGEAFDQLRRDFKMTRRHLFRVLKTPV
jgi:Mor family transcriptional regulator